MRSALLVIPAVAAFGLALAALRLRFPIEEAFIHFRYADNIAHGYGPVFNKGEHVEGFNTPMWEFLLGGLHSLGIPLIPAAHVVGILAGALTVFAAGVIAARLAERIKGTAGAVAALLVALHPATLFWTASGMESAPFMFILLLSTAIAAIGRRPMWAGLLFGITALTRPEGVLFGMVTALMIMKRDGRLALTRFTLAMIAPLLMYESFRIAYYGALLPNVYHAKVGFQLTHGIWYVWQFIRNGGFIFVLALTSLAGRHRRTASFWLLGIGAYVVWIALVGGDFYAFHRFIIPVVPLLAILVALGVETMLGSRPRLAAACALIGMLLWAGSLVESHRYALSCIGGMRGFVHYHRLIGESIRAHAPAGTTIAAIPMGALPYYAGSDIRVIDMLGLTDSHIAHKGVRVTDGLPGHSLYDNVYVLKRRPDMIILQIDPESTELRPLTAAAVRNDPASLSLFAAVGIETGSYSREVLQSAPLQQHHALPAQLDFISPERKAQLSEEYRYVASIPLGGRRHDGTTSLESLPVHAFQRVGGLFPILE